MKPKQKYRVSITNRTSTIVQVEARSADQARRIVEYHDYDEEDIVSFNEGDYEIEDIWKTDVEIK